jgi:hypothetical protein
MMLVRRRLTDTMTATSIEIMVRPVYTCYACCILTIILILISLMNNSRLRPRLVAFAVPIGQA